MLSCLKPQGGKRSTWRSAKEIAEQMSKSPDVSIARRLSSVGAQIPQSVVVDRDKLQAGPNCTHDCNGYFFAVKSHFIEAIFKQTC